MSEFRAQPGEFILDVVRDGKSYLLTKAGKDVARLLPADEATTIGRDGERKSGPALARLASPALVETPLELSTGDPTEQCLRLAEVAAARVGALTFAAFGRANRERCEATAGYHTGVKEYGAATWALCLAEEAGEVMGAVLGATGQKKRKAHLTAKDVGDEVADLVAYADLLLHSMGLDLGTCIAAKWNQVSERIGYPGRLLRYHGSRPADDDDDDDAARLASPALVETPAETIPRSKT